MNEKKNIMVLIMMMGGISGMLCFSENNPVLQLVGFIGSILTMILFLNQIRKDFGLELLNCSVRFTKREEVTATFRIGKNADAYAIIFNSFIAFSWFLTGSIIVNLILAVAGKDILLLVGIGVESIGFLWLFAKTRRDIKKYNPDFRESQSMLAKMCCFSVLEIATLVAWEHILLAFICILMVCIYLYIAAKYYYDFLRIESKEIQCEFLSPDFAVRATLLDGRVLDSQQDILYVIENQETKTILYKASTNSSRVEVFKQEEIGNVEILSKDEIIHESIQRELHYYIL